jgi:hypothetical protein
MPASMLDVLLPSFADRLGKAIPKALYLHRHVTAEPAMVVPFRIGGESFAVAAVAVGFARNDFGPLVVPDPRNRALFFDRITPFAKRFDEWFMSFASQRDEDGVASDAPQLIVPNLASAALLAGVGRRLAYVDAGGYQVDPAVTATGRHLRFLKDQFRVAGQQLVLPLADLMASHWATPQTAGEKLSLPALAAWIAPPAGVHGFDAALTAEAGDGVGPIPPAARDGELFGLVDQFNAAVKAGDTAAAATAEQDIHNHWQRILGSAWDICWDAFAKVRTLPPAASTAQRWQRDREAYTRHADWQQTGGRRRARQTPRQAAETHSKLELAAQALTVQEAIDDPLRMAPYVLRDEAVIGTVVRVDPDHVERSPGGTRRRYPIVTLETPDRCGIPAGKLLWWADDPARLRPWVVHEVTQPSKPTRPWRITLKRVNAATKNSRLPQLHSGATFSVHSVSDFLRRFPAEADVPWTHRLPAIASASAVQAAIDSEPATDEPTAADAPPEGFSVVDAADAQGDE